MRASTCLISSWQQPHFCKSGGHPKKCVLNKLKKPLMCPTNGYFLVTGYSSYEMHLEGERIPGRQNWKVLAASGTPSTFLVREQLSMPERENLEKRGKPNSCSLDLRCGGPSEIRSRLLCPCLQTQGCSVLCIKKTKLQEEIVQLGLLSSLKFWCPRDVASRGRDHADSYSVAPAANKEPCLMVRRCWRTAWSCKISCISGSPYLDSQIFTLDFSSHIPFPLTIYNHLKLSASPHFSPSC